MPLQVLGMTGMTAVVREDITRMILEVKVG